MGRAANLFRIRAMKCPACHAALEVKSEDPLATCEYCGMTSRVQRDKPASPTPAAAASTVVPANPATTEPPPAEVGVSATGVIALTVLLTVGSSIVGVVASLGDVVDNVVSEVGGAISDVRAALPGDTAVAGGQARSASKLADGHPPAESDLKSPQRRDRKKRPRKKVAAPDKADSKQTAKEKPTGPLPREVTDPVFDAHRPKIRGCVQAWPGDYRFRSWIVADGTVRHMLLDRGGPGDGKSRFAIRDCLAKIAAGLRFPETREGTPRAYYEVSVSQPEKKPARRSVLAAPPNAQ